MPEPTAHLRLGIRGLICTGAHPGTQVLVDSVGMTPVDALIVIMSPNLDVPGHPDEEVLQIFPDEIGGLLDAWNVEWTSISDDQCGRFA